MHPLHDDRGKSADRSEEGGQMGTPGLRQRGLVVNETELDVFLEFPCFFYDPTEVGNFISGSSVFSKSNLYMSRPSLKDFEPYLAKI